MNTLLDNEPAARLAVFLAVFAAMLTWEALAPRRGPHAGYWTRRWNNLVLMACNTIILRLLAAGALVGVALFAGVRGWGALNQFSAPAWAGFGASLLLLDLAVYAQHVLLHKVSWLWRLHRVHHTDTSIDVTTGVRFHPLEILVSFFIKAACVVILGASAAAVLVFEILLNATSLFNHANINIAPAVDRILRLFIVTPDMHRVHHSVLRLETDSNYGFNLPWWDRLFRTYRPQPRDGHLQMRIGVEGFGGRAATQVSCLLVQPFRGSPAGR